MADTVITWLFGFLGACVSIYLWSVAVVVALSVAFVFVACVVGIAMDVTGWIRS